MVIKEPGSGYSVGGIDPQTALQALKIKAKVGRRARAKRDAAAAMLVPLDGDGQIHHTEDQFLNEQEIVQEGVSVKKELVNLYAFLWKCLKFSGLNKWSVFSLASIQF